MTRTVKDTLKQFSPFSSGIKLETDTEAQIVLAPELGARVLAVSPNGLLGENLLWTNPACTQLSESWNFGGARTWIAPEDKFYLDPQNHWFVPQQMDPGQYELTAQTTRQVECANEFTICNRDQAEYHVRIIRKIKSLDSPPLPGLVKFAGFEFTHSILNLGTTTWGREVDFMGLWSLVQINPGGTLLVPLKPDVPAAYRNYFNIFTVSHLQATKALLRVKIDGKFRGKLGIAPAAARDWLGYLCDRGPNSYLIIKQFLVDPTGIYLDHPWGQTAAYGDPVQLYNDDGKMGGFGEMECHAPANVLKPGEQQDFSADIRFYTGPIQDLLEFATQHFSLPDFVF
jgi:hypothetical protein